MTPIQLSQLADWIQSSGLAAKTTDQIAAAYVPVVAYQSFWLTAKTIYDQTAGMYHDGYARGAGILSTFAAMAQSAGRPASDFYAQITTPGSEGLDIGSAQAQAFLGSLVDPNGSYTPANPAANPPTVAVTTIAQGKLLTPQEAAVIGSLGSTQTYPIPGVTSIAAADATAALNVLAGRAVAAASNNGNGNAMGAINAAINAGAAPPTPQQVITAYAAAAYPGYTVAVTAPQGG